MPRSFSTDRPDQSPLIGPTSFGPGPSVFARDPLDAARSLMNSDPNAQYPSGYLDSSMTGRRDNLNATASLWNVRGYTRGVHAQSKLDPSAYLWPTEMNPLAAVIAQSQGQKYMNPMMAMNTERQILMNDGKPGPLDYDPALVRPPWS